MSTQCFLLNTPASTHLGVDTAELSAGQVEGWSSLALGTSRGSGVTSDTVTTVTGPSAGRVLDTSTSDGYEWLSEPVSSSFTMSGAPTINLRWLESSMNNNCGAQIVIERVDSQGVIQATIVNAEQGVEFGTVETAQNWSPAITSTNFTKGDRIRITVYINDAGGTMASAGTCTFFWNGTTSGASGDSFVTFAETFSFLTTTPSGSVTYLTDTTPAGFTVSYTGDVAGGTYENIDRSGLVDWINPGNASVSDNVYATVSNVGAGTDYLVCRNLGLSLPAGSVIRGVEVKVEANTTASFADVVTCQLQDGAGALIGSLKSIQISASDAVYTFGGPEDNWNFALTEAIVENANFGVRVWDTQTITGIVSVDQITIKVYYESNGRNIEKEAWTSRGAGVQSVTTDTITGWTPPIQIKQDQSKEVAIEWYTKQLQAFTLSGLIKANLRSSAGATNRASIRAEIAIVNSDGSSPIIWGTGIFNDANGGDIAASETAQTVTIAGNDIAVTNGQRLRYRIYIDDMSDVKMAASQTVTFYYAGTSDGASGDSFFTLPQSVSEFVVSGKSILPAARANRNTLLRR